MHFYDISNDKWIGFVDYPQSVRPLCSLLTIDAVNDLLYITHGVYPLLMILDINTKEWKVEHKLSDYQFEEVDADDEMMAGDGQGIILPNGEFHLLILRESKNEHIRYIPDEKAFKSI